MKISDYDLYFEKVNLLVERIVSDSPSMKRDAALKNMYFMLSEQLYGIEEDVKNYSRIKEGLSDALEKLEKAGVQLDA